MAEQDKSPEQTAVADDKTVSTEPVESSNEPKDDLDSLLNEWDQKPSDEQQKESKKPDAGVVSREEFDALRQEYQANRTREAVKTTVQSIQSSNDGLKNVSVNILEDLLNGAAVRDTRIEAAWTKRAENPKAWAKIVRSLGDQFATDLGARPDKTVEDKEALTAAVRSSTTTPSSEGIPNQADLSKMTAEQLENVQWGSK